MILLMVVARVVNSVRYIPVADATVGCMSISKKTEVNITPGPKPAMAATKDPKNATAHNLKEFFAVIY